MIHFDAVAAALFLIALFFWTRGVWKGSRSDVLLSVLVFAAAVGLYGYIYGLLTLSFVPGITALAGAAAAGLIALIRRRHAPASRVPQMLAIAAAVLGAALLPAEQKWSAPKNSLLLIAPYRSAGTWVFDDPATGLRAEPFVLGIPEIIDRLIKEAGIEGAESGFRLIFAAQPFPNYQLKIDRGRRQNGGFWYSSERYGAEGWLCPALFKYFKRAPQSIYAKAEAKSGR